MMGDIILAGLLLFCIKKLYGIEHRLTHLENEVNHLKSNLGGT